MHPNLQIGFGCALPFLIPSVLLIWQSLLYGFHWVVSLVVFPIGLRCWLGSVSPQERGLKNCQRLSSLLCAPGLITIQN